MTEDKCAKLVRRRAEETYALVMRGLAVDSAVLLPTEPELLAAAKLVGASSREVDWIHRGLVPVRTTTVSRQTRAGLASVGLTAPFTPSVVTIAYLPRYYFPDLANDDSYLTLWLIYSGLDARVFNAILNEAE